MLIFFNDCNKEYLGGQVEGEDSGAWVFRSQTRTHQG